jgi:hypothetical protein
LIILEFINKYGKKNGGYPSLDAIKKGVSNYMSKRTVDRIISDINIIGVCKNHPSKFKFSEFLNSMCQHGLNGNIPAGKLWLALMFGWKEKKMFEIFNNVTVKSKISMQDLTDSLEKMDKV